MDNKPLLHRIRRKTPPQFKRFFKYCLAGTFSAIIDLSILWFLTEKVGLFYLVSATIGFIIGTTIFYTISRKWTFKGTKTKIARSYVTLMLVAGTGLVLTIILLAFFVQVLEINYMISRIIAAFIVLGWTYNMNRHVTFKQPRAD